MQVAGPRTSGEQFDSTKKASNNIKRYSSGKGFLSVNIFDTSLAPDGWYHDGLFSPGRPATLLFVAKQIQTDSWTGVWVGGSLMIVQFLLSLLSLSVVCLVVYCGRTMQDGSMMCFNLYQFRPPPIGYVFANSPNRDVELVCPRCTEIVDKRCKKDQRFLWTRCHWCTLVR